MAYATFMTVADEIRTQKREPLPDEILSRFNRVLFDAVQSNYFMSCFIAVFDLHAGSLTYANAGHPFPMLQCQPILKTRGASRSRPSRAKTSPSRSDAGHTACATRAACSAWKR